jgi:catechol 2,3-dioxygenase-like lactoylglutathione lyase family enzyme
MGIAGFDHYNLRAARPVLEELKAFYCDVVGLTVGERPPFRRFGYWLYAGGYPVLHLSEADQSEVRSRTAVTTFAHAAFNCTGRAEFERKLRERGIAYRTADVPQVGIAQLFFHDPAGNGVELQFHASEPAAQA